VTKTALIIGSLGQDGRLLTEHLKGLKYRVIGIGKGQLNIFDLHDVSSFLQKCLPDEIYYLAAYHHSSENVPETDGELERESLKVHRDGIKNVLESCCINKLSPKIFYASSSLVFGSCPTEYQTELTPFSPESAYGRSKVEGMNVCQNYRTEKGLFVSVGILYNHESPLRSPHFVSRKISFGVANIVLKHITKLELGSLDAIVDWGFAGDFVEAMHLILQQNRPDDFIISTGKGRSLREFVDIAFRTQGLDYRNFVEEKNHMVKRKSTIKIGDHTKLTKMTGWMPKMDFESLVKLMVESDITLIKEQLVSK
jgi:GDPmannose 4,6-dehydratase